MTGAYTKNTFKETLLKAYYYIISADGNIEERELEIGRKMCKKEGIDEGEFQKKIEAYKNDPNQNLIDSLKTDLKKLSKEEQVKVIAYMSNTANSDGFMDALEWKMIYELYKNELQLTLEDIIQMQRQIPPFTN